MFTSGVVLILTQLCPSMTRQFSRDTLHEAWMTCLAFLEQKVSNSSSAKKCAHDLRKAYTVVYAKSQRASTSGGGEISQQALYQHDITQRENVDWAYGVPNITDPQQWDDSFLADLLWDDFITTIPLYF